VRRTTGIHGVMYGRFENVGGAVRNERLLCYCRVAVGDAMTEAEIRAASEAICKLRTRQSQKNAPADELYRRRVQIDQKLADLRREREMAVED